MTTLAEVLRHETDVPEAPPGGRAEDHYEAEVAALSAHLALLQTYVVPLARRRLPHRRQEVRELRRAAGDVARQLRAIQARMHGDFWSADSPLPVLEEVLAGRLAELVRLEQELADRLDELLTPEQLERLVGRLQRSAERAPTRPHPYTPHPAGVGRLLFRFDALWDHALDVMDARIVPPTREPRALRPMGPWGRWLCGAPRFDGEEQD